jgi:flagellar protein FliO/FliZ
MNPLSVESIRRAPRRAHSNAVCEIGCRTSNLRPAARGVLSLLALAAMQALLLPAVGAQQAPAPTAATAGGDGPSLLPMILVLLLVLALIPVSMWLLKRLGAGGAASVAGMKVVATLPLGPRERLVVVEAGERWLVLGVTPSNINRVGTLPKGALPTGATPAAGFAQLLGAARKTHEK